MGASEEITIGPQPGPQTQFLSTSADIAIYGGAAGGGKSFALLLEPLRHIENPEFGGVIFRRNNTQVRNQGGLWDESVKLYLPLGGHPVRSFLSWQFPSGMQMKFGHLEAEITVYDWQGSQIAYIGFDELTHFSSSQFFYMLSRNRSSSGIAGYVRATCNPDVDSWVRAFIDWWIGEDGYPIMDRSGVIRWFIRRDDSLYWGDSREELIAKFGPDELPKSVTFIPSKLQDNKILMEKDPSYLANLRSLSRVERARLEGGNWNVRAIAGTMFRREWFPIVEEIPGGWIGIVRFWDRAGTKPNENNRDPDWTRGLKVYRYPNNTFVIADLRSARDTPGQIENIIVNTAYQDSVSVRIVSQKDPGSAGTMEAEAFVRRLAGFDVGLLVSSADKLTRAKPVSAQCEFGNVMVLKAPWNKEFFDEAESFPDGAHDDIVDCLSGAYNELCNGHSLFDVHQKLISKRG